MMFIIVSIRKYINSECWQLLIYFNIHTIIDNNLLIAIEKAEKQYDTLFS